MRLSLWITGEPIRRFGIKWGSVVKCDDDQRPQDTGDDPELMNARKPSDRYRPADDALPVHAPLRAETVDAQHTHTETLQIREVAPIGYYMSPADACPALAQ